MLEEAEVGGTAAGGVLRGNHDQPSTSLHGREGRETSGDSRRSSECAIGLGRTPAMGIPATLRLLVTALLTLPLGACIPGLDDTDDVVANTPRLLPGGGSNGPFDTCLAQLDGAEVRRVGESVARQFRLSKEDATDVARDAMLKVCVRHAVQPYDRLAAALQMAAANKAKRSWRRQKRLAECPLEDLIPVCDTRQPAEVRFESELRAATAALCQESALDDNIIQERVIDEDDFATIGARHGITADQARTRYHNAMNRVKTQAQKGLCAAPNLSPSPAGAGR